MPKAKVLVAGTFDFLHPGHLDFLSQAKRRGDFLVVVVARDRNAKAFKGKKPYLDEKDRLALVSSLRTVDKAMLGSKGDVFAVVRREKPDVIVLGYDQWPRETELRQQLLKMGLAGTKVFRARPFFEERHKSSKIRRHLEKVWR